MPNWKSTEYGLINWRGPGYYVKSLSFWQRALSLRHLEENEGAHLGHTKYFRESEVNEIEEQQVIEEQS